MSYPRCLAVLIVEENDEIRDVVAGVLEADGFHVCKAENGARALEMLREMPHPSLILADLMMPAMDGWQLVAALAQHERFATLPVVIVSELDDQHPEGFRRIKRPIAFEDLIKIVSELCLRRT